MADQLSRLDPDGTKFGQSSTDKIGFYGATAVVRPTAATAVTTTGTVSTAGIFGFTTSTQANAVITALNTVIATLTTLGLHG